MATNEDSRRCAEAELPQWAHLPGGDFLMGTDVEEGFITDGERPQRPASVAPFSISRTVVTNRQFAVFVQDTGYLTVAERMGSSLAFRPEGGGYASGCHAGTWWALLDGLTWRTPDVDADAEEIPSHPVVHVAWEDAVAYCQWAGGRLPTDVEWEYAARGGLIGRRLPWGDELIVEGQWQCNIWQGDFPLTNTLDDGFAGTSPVGTYPANGFGLYDVSGNVWEWMQDWFDDTVAPAGIRVSTGQRAARGGSFLCHDSYCNRYRVAARTGFVPDTSAQNLGFRIAKNSDLHDGGQQQ